jgi:hypothetical protein
VSRDIDPQTIRRIASAQADALALWRQSKTATRREQYRRRMEQTREADPLPWLLAIERDDRTDPAERELVLEAPAGAVLEVHTAAMHARVEQRLAEAGRTDLVLRLVERAGSGSRW